MSITVGAVVWAAVTFALDGRYDERYAPAKIVQAVEETGRAVNNLTDDVSEVRRKLLVGELISARQEACAKGGAYWAQQLSELKVAYRNLTGAQWPEPKCSDLGIE